MKNQEAVNLIRHIEDPQEAAECLAKEALIRMSRSKISCLVIRFDWFFTFSFVESCHHNWCFLVAAVVANKLTYQTSRFGYRTWWVQTPSNDQHGDDKIKFFFFFSVIPKWFALMFTKVVHFFFYHWYFFFSELAWFTLLLYESRSIWLLSFHKKYESYNH